MLRLRSLLAAAALLLGPAAGAALHAQDPDIIRGTVVGPDSQPVRQAQVTVTSVQAQTSRPGRTNDRGQFTILFANGGGDYFVRIVAIGMQPFETRVQRVEDETVLLVTARMTAAPTVLQAVQVQAERPRVERNPLGQPDVGGSEQTVGAGAAALPPGEAGNLAAMAATIPGVTLIPGVDGGAPGFSVLGLGADQNRITLNGMQVDASAIPRDANVMTRLSTTTFDVSRGGFSGGQLSVQTFPTSNFVRRTISLSLDDPGLQWTDRSAARFGQEYRNIQLGGSFAGPLVQDKAFYNTSIQLGRRSSDLQSILGADAVALSRIGIAADSVARFLSLLDQLGIPATVAGIPGDQRSDNGSFLARLDLAPSGQRNVNFTASGNWSRSGAVSIGPSALPARGGENSRWNGSVQGSFSTYFRSLLNDSRLSLNASASEGSPYLNLPEGRVRVSSILPDGTPGITTLAFGGNNSLQRASRNQALEFTNTTSWFTLDSRHRLKLSAELRYEQYEEDQSSNLLGSFFYNSLADLEQGLPASFSRRLTPQLREGDALNLALSIGDEWRPLPRNRQFRVQYGLRAEATRFGVTPQFNPAVEERFGLRTDEVPNRVHLSPRIGFTWSYGAANRLGGPFNEGPRATLSGGIGEFRNGFNSSLLARAIDNTGLPSGAQLLNCLGPAAPSPEWDTYTGDPAGVPGSCADGSGGTVFDERQPSVFLFDPSYDAQRSWRGNLAWNGRLRDFRLRSEIVHSINLDQAGGVDRNFRGAEQFRLDEEGRPVYVSPASIVAATGTVALRESRVHPEYAQVTTQRSDLRSSSTRLSLNLSPVGGFDSRFRWGVGYNLTWGEQLERGFGGTTAGNPLEREWGPTGESRHQVSVNGGYTFADAISVNVHGRLQSGRRYTPRVSGDVNGDGASNDRAFVYDPAATEDPALAAAMASLFESAPGEVRSCLRDQLGRIAGRNSCTGPWTTSLNLSFGLVPGRLGIPSRTSLSFSVSNPLGALDELFHGSTGLRGWGQNPNPDGTLLYVRGFDAERQRFVYEVNPRFGDTRPRTTVGRQPFMISLQARTSFGPTPEQQGLERQLSQGRTRKGEKLSAEQLKRQFVRGAGGPVTTLLQPQVRDSLRLTPEQVTALGQLTQRHTAAVDSIYAPVAEYLAGLGEKYDVRTAMARVTEARDRSTALMLSTTRAARAILTAEQLRQLPSFLRPQFDERFMSRTRRMGGDFIAF